MASQLITFFRGAFPKVALPDDKSPIELLPVCWSQWPAGTSPPETVLLILDDQRGENLPEVEGNTLGYAAERQLFVGLPPRFRRLISQREPAPTGAEELQLLMLQRQASLELLALQAGESGQARLQADPQAADALCEEVGDLPLALVLLGARLAERPELRLSQLLEELRSKGAEAKALLQAHPELGAQRGVVEALLISWQPLSEEAKSLGILLGVMAPAAIPWELVETCRLPEQAVEEGSAFGEQQVALRRAQMLERLGDGLYILHPLVRQFIRLQSRELEEVAGRWRRQLAAAVTQVCRERIPQSLTWLQVDALEPVLPHIRQVAENDAAELSEEDLIGPFTGLALVAVHRGAFGEALGWHEQGLQECEDRLGPKHPATATALNNLALLLKDTNRLLEAEPLMRRALAINEASYGTDHPEVAISLNNLASLMYSTNRLAEAEPLMRRALVIDEASYGTDHPNVARDLNNLASLLYATNRQAKAEPLMRRHLEILIAFSQQGYQHPHLEAAFVNYYSLLQGMNLPESEIKAKLQSLLPPSL
jgi:tetratricopeptide (TPR) repeat protein